MLKKLNTWKRNDKKIDEARKKLNDSVGLGRRDSIEYLAPGESGRAEDEAGVVRSEVVVKVQANNLGLGRILELAPLEFQATLRDKSLQRHQSPVHVPAQRAHVPVVG